ncbi:BTAD domain-containing putative transcriptional regulator [Kitasatospora sp. NPDC056327]|uniref:BTAD domain-containing putative transcriptional regulator n=1 Tax=Kitasatospora sp. NPDC056327 TaxID=3345785 RepID=UPI0035E2D8E8
MAERTPADGPAPGVPADGPAGGAADGPADGPAPFGPRLRTYRRRAGLSQDAAAARAGISTRALRDLEHDRVRRPRPQTLRRLAGVLELTGGELTGLLAGLSATAPAAPSRDTAGPRLLVLGPFVLDPGRTPAPVTGPMLRRLLGLLALKHPEPATQQEITDVLWPSGPPGSRQNLVHTYVSRARRLLEPDRPHGAPPPAVVRTPTGYRLAAPGDATDLGRFDGLLARATDGRRPPDRAAAYEALTRALRWWRGPVLADADPALSRHPAAVAANGRRIRAALLHADTALLLRRPGEAVPLLGDLVDAEPLHEGLHARLILALAAAGEQAAALDVFGRLRVRLDEELGIAPGPEVRDAQLRVLRRQLPLAPGPETIPVPAALPGAVPATVPAVPAVPAVLPDPRPAQLPAAPGSWVGRHRQLRELDALVAPGPAPRPHLVTVVGPPGIGKTALATHWAHARRAHFRDGQLFVDLRGHSRLPTLRPGDVLAQFLRALGTPPDRLPADEGEAAALYRTLLADRRMLIVLDNARDAEQVRPLIPGAPGCAVVITSRSRLAGLVASDGARRLGLDVLDPDEALHLLAGTVGADRVAAEEEAARRLVSICGGLPLAIRIAGANLLAHGTGIADHCEELAGDDLIGRLHVEGDHRSTVRAAFELSYRALPAAARRMFRLLGRMPGPDLSADAAAALADVPPSASAVLLDRLGDAHLVQRRAAGRFGLHDLLRSYARELAGREETHAAHRRLFDWYLHRADAAARLLYPVAPSVVPARPSGTGAAPSGGPAGAAAGAGAPAAPVFPDHARAAQWLDDERENLAGAVLQASGAGFTGVAQRLAESLHGYLSTGMYTGDCFEAATAGLFASIADDGLRARAGARLRHAGCHGGPAGDTRAVALFTRALDLARQHGWHDGQALALRGIGPVRQGGGMRIAYDHLSRSRERAAPPGPPGPPGLGLPRRSGRTPGTDDLATLGLISWKLGRLDEAAGHFSQVARHFHELGAAREEAVSHTNLGVVHRALGRPGEAIRLLGEALPVHLRHDNKFSEAVALSCLSGAHTDLGDHTAGRRLAHTALAAARTLRNRALEANALLALGAAQEAAREPDGAAESYREALRLAEAVNDRFPQAAALVGLATARTAAEPVTALRTAERAVALAREAEFRMIEGCALTAVAAARVRLGDSRTALRAGRDALALHRETGHRPGEARSQLALGQAQSALGAAGTAVGHWREALRLSRAMGAARIR